MIRLKKSQFNEEINKFLFNKGDEIMVVSNQQVEWGLGDISDIITLLNNLNKYQLEAIHIKYNID